MTLLIPLGKYSNLCAVDSTKWLVDKSEKKRRILYEEGIAKKITKKQSELLTTKLTRWLLCRLDVRHLLHCEFIH